MTSDTYYPEQVSPDQELPNPFFPYRGAPIIINGVIYYKGDTRLNRIEDKHSNIIGQGNRLCYKCGCPNLHWEGVRKRSQFNPSWILFTPDGEEHKCPDMRLLNTPIQAQSEADRIASIWSGQYQGKEWKFIGFDEMVHISPSDFCFTCQKFFDISHSCKCENNK